MQFEFTELYFAGLPLKQCAFVKTNIYLTFEEQIGPPLIACLMVC